ncbi:MAG: hypothetical protein LBD25_03430 [Coriobacteriales bacterium]|jgi:hypothetical protein|nr:hypothetical protein [Coriobacteriales bacterium]
MNNNNTNTMSTTNASCTMMTPSGTSRTSRTSRNAKKIMAAGMVALALAAAAVVCLPIILGSSLVLAADIAPEPEPPFAPDSAPEPDPAPAPSAPTPPTTVTKGVVLDTTTSTDAQFCESVRASLVDELTNWGGDPPNNDSIANGVEARPGLELWLFLVGDNPSKTYTSPHLHLTLPPVMALPARPALTDDDVLEATHEWNKQRKAYEAERDRYLKACDEATAALQAWVLYTEQNSGIHSTVTALRLAMAQGGDVLIASDLKNNQDAQVTGGMEGSRVYVIQSNPFGDLALAESLYRDTVDYLRTMGVDEGNIKHYYDARAPEAVAAFMRGL